MTGVGIVDLSLNNLKRRAAAFGIAAVGAAGGATQAGAQYLPPADIQNALSAVRAYGTGNWDSGRAAQRRIGDPVVRKVVAWYAHTRLGSQSSFAEITRFIQDNPHWPWQKQLRRNAELSVRATTDPGRIVAFYKGSPPYSFAGQKLAIDRLTAAGRKTAAVNLIRSVWANRYLRRGESAEFRSRYGAHLRPEDNYNRLDYLLFAGHKRTARRMYRQLTLTAAQQAGIRARLQMNLGRHYCGRRRGAYTAVTATLSRVPYKLRRGEGFSFDMMRYFSCARQIRKAVEAMATQPSRPRFAKRWWRERSKLARDAIQTKQYRLAYEIARGHRQYGQQLHAHAEWFAGFIAFRFLRNHKRADQHFRGALASVESAWTRSKILYWHGLLKEAQGQNAAARPFFQKAAKLATTFYGQLAHGRAQGGELPLIQTKLGRPARRAFWQDDIVKGMVVARRIGMWRESWSLARYIMIHRAKTPEEHMYAVGILDKLTSPAKRRQMNVRVIKYAQFKGHPVIGKGYPTIALPKANTVEPALIYALIRQESEFQPAARSWAGARGYMQLMPFTARAEARDLKLRYRTHYLTRRPAYNLRLGTHHVARLIEALDGAYPMVLAAYNAGEHRVTQWIAWHGDPREKGGPDWATWIELIKFDETRDYVKRVLEGHMVYRMLLKDKVDTKELMAYWTPPEPDAARACEIVRMAEEGRRSGTAVAARKTARSKAGKASAATMAEYAFGRSLVIQPRGKRKARAKPKSGERPENPLALVDRKPHDNVAGAPECNDE